MPSVGFDIAPEGCHLVRDLSGDHRDGAVIQSRRDGAQPARLCQANDHIRGGIGGQVDIGDRSVQQRVAYAAADEKRLMAGFGQQPADALGLGPLDPVPGDARHAANRSARPRRIRAVAPQM